MAIRIAAAVAVTAGLSVLLYSPVLGQGGWQAVTPLDRSWGPIRDLVSAVWGNWNRAAVHPLDWLIAAGFLASLALHRRIGRQPVPIAAAALATLAGVIAVGPLSPFVRSWLYLLPLYLIAAGAGLAWAARQIARSWEPVAALAAACAAVALAAATSHAGLRGADVPPISDNDIIGLLHRLVPAHQRAVLNRYVAAPVRYYYFYRFGGESLVTRRVGRTERDAGHVVVVVPHGEPPLVTFHMAHGAASGPPRHLLSREWIDFYDVPVANVRVP
jgi:hypothetical protein